MCLTNKLMKEEWHVDSRCSRHMTRNTRLFCELKRKDYGNVRFGDNAKGRIAGKETAGINPNIEDVSLVMGLNLT